jgi:hypothetical protein
MSMDGARAGWGLVAVLAGASLSPAAAQEPVADATPPGIRASAGVEPGAAKLGERVIYRGRVVAPAGQSLRYKWLPPEPDQDLSWGKLAPRLASGRAPGAVSNRGVPDTLHVEAGLQVFRVGEVTIPGLRFQSQDPARPTVYRLPAVRLIVTSMLTPADSNADLRPMRGPIRAPWWERVPWMWVALGILLLAAIVWVIVRLRRRKPAAPVQRPQPMVASIRDPAAVALAELKALRAQNLPGEARYSEHAFQLSRILRKFLEATAGTPRPGDTTGELIAHLEASGIDHEDLQQLAGLLRIWDRVKFARAPSSPEEATRAEQAVETMARRALRNASPAERAA